MKNLYQYVIYVNDNTERKIALEFYRQATKRPFFHGIINLSFGYFVGMSKQRDVVSNNTKYDYEKVVPFTDIATLADSPSRKIALEKATKKYTGLPLTVKMETPEPKKTPSKMLPVVAFWYPSSVTRQNVERKIRVVKADTIHIIGFDINKNEQFKKFKRAKVSGLVSLVAFNV